MPKHVSGSRAMSSSEPVNVIAGWMASGMQPCSVSGASTPTPLAPEVCATIVPGRTAPVAARPEISAGEFGVGHGEQQQFGAVGDLVDRQHRGVGQPALCPLAGRVGDGAAGDHDVLGALQRNAERGADPTSGNDADREPRRAESVGGSPSQTTSLRCRKFLRSGPALRVPDGRYETSSLVAATATAAPGGAA